MPAPASPHSSIDRSPLPAHAPPAAAGGRAVVELRPAVEAVAAGAPEVGGAAPAVRVVVRLSNGERIEVGAHAQETAAKAEATALMRFLREPGGDWPFLSGRFVRPEAIVSVDVVAG